MPATTTHNSASSTYDEDIAIIGIDLKFPGDASTPEGFQKLLLEGRSALSDIGKERYNIDAFYHPDPERAGAINIRKGHHIKGDLAAFDAPFFSIPPAEAACMDPQQRGLLECVYRALENAGIPMEKAVGSDTSVYIGCFTREYDGVITRDPELDLRYLATGTGTAMLSNRLSWFYDFHGASMTLDTACSSSLMACHLACNSLKMGESSMAIVGGANLFYNPDTCIPLTSLGFLSPDSKCYSFDHRANGYSRGEGFGILLLKRLSDAVRDQDTIRAVIRSTVANQDGKSPGITQPTKQAQVDAAETAYRQAGLDPSVTRFFEAHGTGTPVGDPIEASAIAQVFSKYRSPEEPLIVGAVKSNIGHLEGAAGIAGLIKAVQVLETGVIPPNIWFEKANPKILPEWHLKFPTETTLWPTDGLRRASINSFGYGGSNAHVIMDDAFNYLKDHGLKGQHCTTELPNKKLLGAPKVEISEPIEANGHSNGETPGANGHNGVKTEELGATNGHSAGATKTNGSLYPNAADRIFVLSSADESGIDRLAETYQQYLSSKKDQIDDEAKYLEDLSFTLSSRRSQLAHRANIVAPSIDALIEKLGGKLTAIKAGTKPKLAFIFTGQGAQWYAMGRELLEVPSFKESLDSASDYLHEIGCEWTLTEELMKDEKSSRVNDAEFSQPLCTALQIALVDLLTSYGVSAGSVVGHSSGEIAAAYAVRAISKSTALRLAFHRGALSSQLSRGEVSHTGGMMSVGLGQAEAESYIAEIEQSKTQVLVVACVNSPKNVTISGSVELIDALKEKLDENGVFARKLTVQNAYHSPLMEPIAAEYNRVIGKMKAGVYANDSARPTFYSSLEGKAIDISALRSPGYWVKNLLSPVLFSQALSALVNDSNQKTKKLGAKYKGTPITELVEIGPHAALKGPVREILAQLSNTSSVAYESVLVRKQSATTTLLQTIGWLFCKGHDIDFNSASDAQPKLLVDLPGYPFNHTKTFWAESRLSKGYRFRQHARHELLGAPVPDWDKSNAIWRNWIRVNENPWVKDHRVTGATLYPAAGMLVMAIEASVQLATPERKIKGFRFKEVSLHMALRVPLNSDGVETHFHMRPYVDSTALAASNWSEFELRSYENDGWVEHCRGLIQTEYEVPYTPVDNGLEDRLFAERCVETVRDAETSCTEEVQMKQLYEILQTVGFDFGPTFQNLSDVRIDAQRNSVATVTPPDIKSKMAYGHIQPHYIHPTTLDGVIQSVVVAMTMGGKEMGEVMIPTSFKKLWLSADGAKLQSPHRVHAHAKFLGLRQAEATFTSIDAATGEPLVVAEGFVSTAIAQNSSNNGSDSGRHLCFNIDWKPDVSFVNQEIATRTFLADEELLKFDPSELIKNLETLCFLYMKRYMKTATPEMEKEMKPHHQKYVDWMRWQFERYADGKNFHLDPDMDTIAEDDTYLKELEDKMDGKSPEATLVVAVGRAMPDVLAGKLDPLQVLFAEKRAENVYRAATGAAISYQRLSAYVDALATKEPGMKILEIGAGTGGMTHPMLETLTHYKDPNASGIRFASYDFTDISPSFFEKAREVFHYAVDRMNFKTLNIENDPVAQGFELGKYDLVVAANIFHATQSLDVTLKHVRKLMKPGAQLLLYEITNNTLMQTGFGFGLLPGWWLSEENYRQWSPLLSVPDWSEHMKRTGFTGVDLSFTDYHDPNNHVSSLMVATASTGDAKPRARPEVILVTSSSSGISDSVAANLDRTLARLGVESRICSLLDLQADDFAHKVCIFLGDLQAHPFLLDMAPEQFDGLKKMVTSASGLLWLAAGGGPSCKTPTAELVTGFSRTVRAENPKLKFVTLSLENGRDVESISKYTTQLFDAIFLSGDESVVDNQFAVVDGTIHIPRLVEATYMDKAINAKTNKPRPVEAEFGSDPSRALKMVVGSPGLLDTLHFIDDPLYEQSLADDQVEFKVMASGLNFLDIMVSLGQVIGNQIGIEASGIVTRAGKDSPLKPGDRVAGMLRGSVKTYARTPYKALAKLPDNLSFINAATLPVVFVTAYCVLYDIANVQPGETVLIHAAAGGVGQACIQLAHLRGAEVYATVGSLDKCELLQKEYGIPRDHIFSSRDLTFAQGIKRMTKGRGVDVVVNALSGAALRASWDVIAPFGRFVEIGKVDIYSSARLNMEKFKNNVRFEFLDVSYFGENHEDSFNRVLKAIMQLVAEGKISELRPVTTYPLSRVEEAFRYMQSGAHSGKIVIEPHDDDKVMIMPSQKPTYHFDPNASYVISGGLGGLGRSMASWMVRRGAKNLILLSRFGPVRESGQKLIAELESQGVRVVAPPCDVTSRQTLEHVLEDCQKDMPPIKGCIQGSMVLKDAVFANMTLEDYDTAVRPKVHASWNLHEVLPKDMDFFILLSSGSGIVGKGGQANYCVGNAYQDALARYRVSHGLKATVLDLGIILSVGYAAEKIDVMGHLRAQGYAALREEEYHALLDEICNPANSVAPLVRSQISLGFEIPETLRSKGIEFPGWMHEPLFKHIHQIRTMGGNTEESKDSVNYSMLLAGAETLEAAENVITKAIVQKLSRALGIDAATIDSSQPLHAYGVDSLVAVELRTWLSKEMGAEVAVFDMVGDSTIRSLGTFVAARSTLVRINNGEN
ncbi:Highly reducing polyketide synthase alt5 [Colletotrichum fructicola]|nr:Highly reducing polyketide synthase [Colletotrichum fructicola]KAI8287916.1 Highly reducing polyketide synthase [Colletotrichum sp. SAR11_57]KAE9567271.1 Highly reducing polyketide synthase [Colletotrichum fructicola]KAF4427290.1 Highly reducing polyketide synthase alt5 [Colletotrichum fructicola]KAF4890760.1 Highly reducing polyketide synthase alt5 [Colletotrichum fructicola]KAF4895429.1 Highly reducing polyketide synthase alt5 [Colletotrichum fructicola]